MIKAGIIGGAGYTAGELCRILVNHPQAEIDFVYSTSNAGNKLSDVHEDLIGDTDLIFSSVINKDVNVVFLCLGHGNSSAFIEANEFSANTKIIDLSNDFRLDADMVFMGKEFVYGLPETNRKQIKKANYIANPGCFATAIQLAILPLASKGLLKDDLHVNYATGSTGAGVKPMATTHFSWRNNNFSTYKEFTHQHLGEIGESIVKLQPNFNNEVIFMPSRGDFPRGIFGTMYTKFDGTIEEAYQIFEDFYKDSANVVVSDKKINMKQVVGTNKGLVHLMKYNDKLLVTSTIDNLLKGASGQAVQNMNMMFGLDELTGLKIQAQYF
ncbi:MAG: N-acetyl-gamma-glutamyl-phosphate reductase [Ichthyobacteriaceae bacterium]|nr:N-acetyl-gamma-glutamyl-phosphate reductase [Ichthyobacteriaceae bacterium]